MYKQPTVRSIVSALILLGSSWAGAAAPAAVSSPTATLQDCYQRALKVSETLAIDDEEIRQLDAQYRRTVGAVLPEVTWNMTQIWQDTSNVEESSGGVQGTLLRSRRPESYFQLRQPIFNGLKEFNALHGFRAAREGARLQREQAALNLLEQVGEVFYVALDLQQEIEVLTSQRDLTADRLKELQRRVRLGRSRDSEVLSSQVEMASLNAQIEDTRQRWSAARQTLYFLTELPAEIPLSEEGSTPSLLPLETAINKSAGRADLAAAEQNRIQQHYRVRYAQGGYLPALDFTGRYYTERVGFNDAVKWDALLSLTVPIFSGFQTRSEVQVARSQVIAADLEWSRLKRMIRQQVQTAHQNLGYTLSQAEFYTQAVDLAQRNYKLQQEEYRLGLINNLQVLQVLTDLQDLKVRKIRSDAAARVYAVRLQVAMGQGL